MIFKGPVPNALDSNASAEPPTVVMPQINHVPTVAPEPTLGELISHPTQSPTPIDPNPLPISSPGTTTANSVSYRSWLWLILLGVVILLVVSFVVFLIVQ